MHQQNKCGECGSLFLPGSSQISFLCPECAHFLYNCPPCAHEMPEGHCRKCRWDGSVSDYIAKLKDRRIRFLIRKAEPRDEKTLADLIRVSFRNVAIRYSLTPLNCPKHPSNYTQEWIASDHHRGVVYFILYQNNMPVGCVGLERPGPDICFLERLAVLPPMRRNGCGRILVEHVLACAEAGGAASVGIGIIAKQIELKQWYERLGFAVTSTKRFQHLPFEVMLMEHRFDNALQRRISPKPPS